MIAQEKIDILKTLDGYEDIPKDVINFLTDNKRVHIYYNDEAGIWQWSIMFEESNGYWLYSYENRADAINLCDRLEIEIIE